MAVKFLNDIEVNASITGALAGNADTATALTAGNKTIDGNLTIGENLAGHNFKAYGNATYSYMIWDAQYNFLKFSDPAKIVFGTGVHGSDFDSSIQADGYNLVIYNDVGDILIGDTVIIDGYLTVNDNIVCLDDVVIGAELAHYLDDDTKLTFDTDKFALHAGGVEMLTGIELDVNQRLVVNDGGADMNFIVESTGNDAMLFVDGGNNRVGIGTSAPAANLHIIKTNDDTRDGIRIQKNGSTYWDIFPNSTGHLYFNYNGGAYGGYIAKDYAAYRIDFTGQHRSLPSTGLITDYTSSIGYIVISDGAYGNFSSSNMSKPNINESLPNVSLSTIPMDKRVFGVISDIEDSGNERLYEQGAFVTKFEKDDSDTRLIINSLGEGAIWVSNYSGSLENGDYITTSPISGLGMKQDDDLLHNYTVAKITQDCNFRINSTNYDCVEFELDGSTYRKAFVGCTYHCG